MLVLAWLITVAVVHNGPLPVYKDPTQPVNSRVADLLSKKTELTNSALDDKSGTRAIHIACKNGDKDMIRELMKRNCFLNQKDSKGCTALMLAAAAGHDKIVKLIVDGGADVRMKDRNDDTALEYAEKHNRVKVKELLNLYACEYTW